MEKNEITDDTGSNNGTEGTDTLLGIPPLASASLSSSSSCTDLVPYSMSNPFHDLLKVSQRLFHIFSSDILISQAWKPGGSGGTELGYGASVYNSSIVLAYFIESMRHQFLNKIGIELGPFFSSPSFCVS
jgi:hypothetical protein